MTEFSIFLTMVAGTLKDPLGLIGYIFAGAAFRNLWAASGAAVVWAFAMELVALSLSPSYDFHVLPARVLGALIVSGLVILVARYMTSSNRSP